jgi:hypothetical protein
MEHPIPLEELSPALHKYVDPSGPTPARMMAAKGLVPLGPAELMTVLYQLNHDPDEQVCAAASEKCTDLPENIVQGALKGDLDARVLDFYVDRFRRDDKTIEIIIFNHAIADETVARVASWSNERLSEVIATNEQRLLRHPEIIANLYNNKNARMSTVNRAIELAVRNEIELKGIAAYKEVKAAIKQELIVEEPGETLQDREFAAAMAAGDAIEQMTNPDEIEENVSSGVPTEELKYAHQKWSAFSITDKIRAATLQPVFLPFAIREGNRIVALAAVKSGKITDSQAVAYSRNKTLHEEVIRYISDKKEWTKFYRVKLHLVENPKTPLPKALNFLSHLREHDLRRVSRDKNVPAAISQAARNQLRKRNK